MQILFQLVLFAVCLLDIIGTVFSTNPETGGIDMNADQNILDILAAIHTSKFRSQLEPVSLALVAPQNTGKSTFIDILVGYPVTYSQSGLATLCPVKFSLRQSNQDSCKVNGIDVKLSEVAQQVEAVMKGLNNVVSTIPLVVEISGPNVLTLDIMDLPGWPNFGSGNQPAVRSILESVLQVPNTIIVELVDGSNTDQENYLLANDGVHLVLDDIVKDWRQRGHFTVVNQFNKAMPGIFTVDNIHTYFKGQANNVPDNFYFVMLVPDGKDVDHMTVTQKADYFMKVREHIELKSFEDFFVKIDPSGTKIDPTIHSRVGVKSTTAALQSLIKKRIKTQLPDILKKLFILETDRTKELDDLTMRLGTVDPTVIHGKFLSYVQRYIDCMRAILNHKRLEAKVQILDENDKLTKLTFDPYNYAETFETELLNAHKDGKDDAPGILALDAIKEILSQGPQFKTGLGTRLDFRSYGPTALERLFQVFSLFICYTQPFQPAYDELYNAGTTGMGGGSRDTKSLIFHVLQKSIDDLGDLVPWVCNHIKYIFLRHHKDVQGYLTNTTEYASLRDYALFHTRIEDHFTFVIKTALEKIRTEIYDLIRDQREHYQLDWYQRLIAVVVLAPYEKDYCNKHNIDVYPKKSSDVDDVMFGAARNYVPEGVLREPIVTGKATTDRCDAMAKIIEILQDSATTLSKSNLIENGDATPQDQSNVEFQYTEIMVQAEKHFHFAKFNLVFALEQKLNTRLVSYMENQYFNDFQRDMLETFANLSPEELDVYLQGVAVDRVALERRKIEVEKDLADIHALMNIINKVV